MPAGLQNTMRKAGPVLGVLALLALLGWGIYALVHSGGEQPRRIVPEVVQLKLIQPPPPPPPPPPPEQKIEPPKEQTPQMKVEELQQTPPSPEPPSDAPPGPPALDAAGEGGSDGFGLGGKPGGAGYGGGGGGGSRFGWYYSKVHDKVYAAMDRRKRLREQRLELTAQIWVEADGRISRVALLQPSGKSDIDDLVLEALRSIGRLDVPPADMPQPMNLRLGARNRGTRFNS